MHSVEMKNIFSSERKMKDTAGGHVEQTALISPHRRSPRRVYVCCQRESRGQTGWTTSPQVQIIDIRSNQLAVNLWMRFGLDRDKSNANS